MDAVHHLAAEYSSIAPLAAHLAAHPSPSFLICHSSRAIRLSTSAPLPWSLPFFTPGQRPRRLSASQPSLPISRIVPMSGRQPPLPQCTRCVGTRSARACARQMCAACCRLLGGCAAHLLPEQRAAAAAAAAAPAALPAAAQPAPAADVHAGAPVVDPRRFQLALPAPLPPLAQLAPAPAQAPQWLQPVLDAQQQQGTQLAQLHHQLAATVAAFQQAMQALAPAAQAAQAASHPAVAAAAAQHAGLPPPPQPVAAHPVAPPPPPPPQAPVQPHLQAFGVAPQVGPHIHYQIEGVNINPSSSAISMFNDSLDGALKPAALGTQLPSIEQLFQHSARTHKPYSSDDEFRSACMTRMQRVMDRISAATDEPQKLAIRHLIAHIQQTRDYIDKYGHKLAWEYHKRVCEAINAIPPFYDPATNGPVFTQAYLDILHGREPSRKSGYRHSSSSKSESTGPANSGSGRTGKRTREPRCDLHPMGHHSKAQCRGHQPSTAPTTTS